MNRNIIISFSITIILTILLGIVSIVKMMELSDLTQKLYKHPFTVVNATKNIKINLITMHKHMRDLVLSSDTKNMQVTIEYMDSSEMKINKEFEIIFDRYLGDKKDIQVSYDAFVQSKLIRDKVILLIKTNKVKEAREMMKNRGMKHVANLNNQVDKMISYAQNKAIYFKDNALENEINSILSIIILLATILIIVFSVLVILIRGISNSEKKLKEHFHLIDQNIMSAKSNKNCRLVEASSALALHLGLSKDELLLKDEYFLFSDCSKELQKKIKITIESGKEWSGEIFKFDSNGDIKWLDSHITPLLDENFNITGYTNILHDISSKKKIEEISRVDGLTNLYNRRFFDETFPKTIKIAKRQDQLLCFVMMDIDHFKQYNDTYGHQEGDTALKKVASILKRVLKRPDDYSFRLGGEEFGMLYMVKSEEDAIKIAQKTRESIEALKILHSGNSASEFVTVSMGVYVIKLEDNSSIEEIYSKSDEALYEAKQSGRNRVVQV